MSNAHRNGEINWSASPSACEYEISADELLRALLHLAPERRAQILDSGGTRGGDDEARFLIAGFDPFETVEARGDELLIERRGETNGRVERGSLLSLLDERLARYRVRQAARDERRDDESPSHLPVAGGACIASFAYDFARGFQRLRSVAPSSNLAAREPDAALAFYDTLVVHDYARNATYLVSVAGERQLLRARAALDEARQVKGFADAETKDGAERLAAMTTATSNFTRAGYVAAVRRIKRHIYAGDIYQANLTQQFTCPLAVGDSAERVFLRLRRQHPASFAAFLRRREDTVVSASPERFLRVSVDGGENGRRVEAWPIKGTRARGATPDADSRLRSELQRSAKDAAENVMIVDLLRNDLGRVCRYGTVEVGALCEVQEHPTLFHLVSKVRGRLRAEVTAGELLRATFPCGSITGAPKLRAMEIIDDCERAPRGLSMGAVGYFSFDGRIDLSVTIRTMTLQRDDTARFNVGGGIVAESDAEAEYEESLVKARALLNALGARAGGAGRGKI